MTIVGDEVGGNPILSFRRPPQLSGTSDIHFPSGTVLGFAAPLRLVGVFISWRSHGDGSSLEDANSALGEHATASRLTTKHTPGRYEVSAVQFRQLLSSSGKLRAEESQGLDGCAGSKRIPVQPGTADA